MPPRHRSGGTTRTASGARNSRSRGETTPTPTSIRTTTTHRTSARRRSSRDSGEHYVFSQTANISYKRLTRVMAVPSAGGDLTFWVSYSLEAAWDHLFVEARSADGGDWTTLPDANGHTTQATGESCPAGWRALHPHLDHYQTLAAGRVHAQGLDWRVARGVGWLRRLAAMVG